MDKDKILKAFKEEKDFVKKDYEKGKDFLNKDYYQGYLYGIKRCSELLKKFKEE
jgi:transcription elongation factor